MSLGPLDKSLCCAGSDHQALLGPEGAVVHSTATLRILASMPSRTIGEWDPLPLALVSAPGCGLGQGFGVGGWSVSL